MNNTNTATKSYTNLHGVALQIEKTAIRQTAQSHADTWFVDYRGSNVGSAKSEPEAIRIAESVRVLDGRWSIQ